MERSQLMKKVQDFVNKYKFVILILMIGLVLMLLPSGKQNKKVSASNGSMQETQPPLSQQLETILSTVSGAGRVRVILTIAAGEEVVYQTNDDISTNENGGSTRNNTVVVTDSERNETGLVKNKNAPVYRGALVVCDGAENPTVALSVVDAVSKVTGLSTDRISVLKMQ